MNIKDYQKLKNTIQQAKPYQDNDEINDERSQKNGTAFVLSIEFVPKLIEIFELYCEVNGNTLEEVFEAFNER